MFGAWIRAGIAAVGVGAMALVAPAATAQTYYGSGGGVSVSVGVFFNALAPYGTWQYVQGYGQVWRPDPYVVGADFVPYGTAGRWVYTDYGWAWQSDWDWGWAPFHYGRWTLDSVLGWVWIPGSVWAPAWVQWRYGGGYVGWCPLAPVGFGFAYNPYAYWSFVPTPYFIQPNPIHYVVPRPHFHQAFAATRPLPHQVTFHQARWYAGPPPGVIARQTGRTVAPVSVRPPVPGHVQPVRPMGVPPPAYHPPLGTQAQRPAASPWRPGYGGSARPPPGVAGHVPVGRVPGTVTPPNRPMPPTHFEGQPPRYQPPPTNFAGQPHYVPPMHASPPTGYAPPTQTPPPTRYAPPPTQTPPPSYGGASRPAAPPPSAPPSGGSHAPPPGVTSHASPPSGGHAAPPSGGHASPPRGQH